MEYKAYAKINLCLKVLGKSDEMHELDMINAKINLYDELVVRWNPELQENSKGECKISCEEMEFPENNTLTSAYQAFCEVLEMTDLSVKVPSILVQIKKNIPMQTHSNTYITNFMQLALLCLIQEP